MKQILKQQIADLTNFETLSQQDQAAAPDSQKRSTGRWTIDEHFRFIEALQLHGKEWRRVQQHVGTRSSTQARSHAQKFFVKLDKKGQRLEDFLASIDLPTVLNQMIEAGSDQDYEDPQNYQLKSKLTIRCAEQQVKATKIVVESVSQYNLMEMQNKKETKNELIYKPLQEHDSSNISSLTLKKRFASDRNLEYARVDLGMNVKSQRPSIKRSSSKSFNVISTLKRQKTDSHTLNAVATEFNTQKVIRQVLSPGRLQKTLNEDAFTGQKLFAGPEKLKNQISQKKQLIFTTEMSQEPVAYQPFKKSLSSDREQKMNFVVPHIQVLESSLRVQQVFSMTPRPKEMRSPLLVNNEVPKRSTSLMDIESIDQMIKEQQSDIQDDELFQDDYGHSFIYKNFNLTSNEATARENVPSATLPTNFESVNRNHHETVKNSCDFQTKCINQDFVFDQSKSQIQIPDQRLLFQNIAADNSVPPPLIKEFLTRNSFDIDDQVMEMTPQSFQRYQCRKFSELNQYETLSPRGQLYVQHSASDQKPRVHVQPYKAPQFGLLEFGRAKLDF